MDSVSTIDDRIDRVRTHLAEELSPEIADAPAPLRYKWNNWNQWSDWGNHNFGNWPRGQVNR